jgi:WD40 repeat protein
VIDRRSSTALALVLLATALTARAADDPAPRPPLPPGAKARFGAPRSPAVLATHENGAHMLAPDYRRYLTGGGGATGPLLHDTVTAKTTAVPGFEAPDPTKERPDGRIVFAVSADGKRAVTERAADAYLVFEVATGKTVRVVKVPGGAGVWASHEVSQAALSADGTVLAFDAGGKGPKREVVVWDVEKDAQLARVGVIQNQDISPVLAPDGKKLATRGRHQSDTANPDGVNPATAIQLWDLPAGKLIATLPDAFPGYGAVAFSPDGRTLAATCESDGSVRLWDAATGKPGLQLAGRSQQGRSVAFSPDGKTLATLGRNGAIDRWALPEGKSLKPTSLAPTDLKTIAGSLTVEGLVFADNERVIAWGWDAALKTTLVWEAPNAKPLAPPVGHFGAIAAVQFTADGKELVTAGMDRRVIHWDLASCRPTVVAASSPRWRSSYSRLSPDGTRGLANGAVYDLATGEELFAIPGVNAFASSDFRRAAGFHYSRNAGADATWCEVWDLEKRKRLVRLTSPIANAGGGTATFSPDNSRLVTTMSLADPKSSDQQLVVIGWEAATGKKLNELRVPVRYFRGWIEDVRVDIAVADNSRVLVAAPGGKLWAGDYARGDRGEPVAELTRPRQRFTVPTFSPDGKTFAVGMPVGAGLEYGVGVYDWPGGKLLHTFTGHAGVVTALSFSTDGKALASGSTDGTVLVWDMAAVGRK